MGGSVTALLIVAAVCFVAGAVLGVLAIDVEARGEAGEIEREAKRGKRQ